MNSTPPLYVWSMRALFVGLCCLSLMLHLLPLGLSSSYVFAPDIILCLIISWTLRRPEFVPVLLIALIALLSDLMLSRPPGLWAAMTLLFSEYMRKRQRLLTLGLAAEWFRASLGITAMFVINYLVLSLLLVDAPGRFASFAQLISTLAMYPIIVLACTALLQLNRPEQPRTGKLQGGG